MSVFAGKFVAITRESRGFFWTRGTSRRVKFFCARLREEMAKIDGRIGVLCRNCTLYLRHRAEVAGIRGHGSFVADWDAEG